MIFIKFFLEKDNTVGLTVTGHANSADYGKDVICAAVSILAYTVAQNANEMYKRAQLVKRPHIVLNDGDAKIIVKPKEDALDEAVHIFYVIERGCALLAANFPEYVTLTTFGEDMDSSTSRTDLSQE